jgi:hypothetical protein
MTQNRARYTSCNITLPNMQIGSADCGLGELDDSISWLSDSWLWAFLQLDVPNCSVDEGLHGGIGSLADWWSKDVTV